MAVFVVLVVAPVIVICVGLAWLWIGLSVLG
jgi:hypothetical protein